MSALDKIRLAFPDLKNSSDSELLGEISKLTGTPYESAATMFGVAPRGTAAETARQIGAGFAVDLPRMVGQGLQYTGVAPETGRSLVESAQERAPGWTPDMRGHGLIGEALVTGGRAVGPMAPAIAASFVPGGQFVAPTVAAGLFGTSSAQETYQKLIDQGISEQDAVSAARRVGLVQGPLEGVATAVGLGAFRAAKPLVGLGGTTAGVAARMTDSAVLKPFAKGMAANLAVQPATEVAQDVGTAKIEEAYGGKPEDIAAIARQSALGGVGLTLLLGPLAMGGHVARANRAEKLKEALYSPETPTEIRAQALDLVMGEARRQNIPEAGVDQWFEQQLAMEDARNAELAKLEAETKAGERDLLITEEEPLQQRIDQKLGLTRTEDRKNYAKQFEAAFTEGTGQRVADAVTGIEREVTAGELVQRDLPQDLTVAVAEEAKQPTPSIFSALDTELLKQGVKPTKNSRELYQYMVAENIDPASPEAEPVLNALANSKLGEARKAVGEIIRARSPRGAGISTVSQPAGSVGVGSPVVQGGVGAAGSPVALTGGNAQPAGTTGAPVQQAGVLPVAASQPAAPVTTGAPSGPQASQTIQAAPQGQTAAAVPTAPAEVSQPLAPGQFRRAPRPMTVLESARAVPTPPVAPVAAEPAAPDIIGQIFGEDDADIIRGFLQGRSSTELAAEAKAKGIKGRGEQMIRNKIAGEMAVRNEWPKKIAAAKQKFGYTDAQIQQALEASMAPDADTRSEVERELNLGRANLYGARMSETEAIEAGLEGSVKSAGAGSSAVKGFTKPQKEIDAMYKRLETDKDDPLVMAWVSNRLTELTEKVEQLEDNIQAKIRAVAGVEEADADAEVQQKAEPTKAKAESKKAKEPAAPVVPVAALDADTKAATDQAKAKWQAANRDLTKLNVADLNLLRNNALRLRNTALAESIAQEIQAQGGETNAVQVESPASVPVQPKAEAGQGVVAKVRGAKKPAAEGKAKVPAVVLTEAEQAAQAWDVVAADYPTAPKFADLTKDQQETFIEFGPGNWERSDVETELTKLARTAAPTQRAIRLRHGTTAANKAMIEKLGHMDPEGGERQYTYSEFGRKAVYLTRPEGWWLDKEQAAAGRAVVYDSFVDVELPSDVNVVTINNMADFEALAKRVGEPSAQSMANKLAVDGLDWLSTAKELRSITLDQAVQKYIREQKQSAAKYGGFDTEGVNTLGELADFLNTNVNNQYTQTTEAELRTRIRDNWLDAKSYELNTFGESDAMTQKLIDAGVDVIDISPDADVGVAADQVVVLRPELVKLTSTVKQQEAFLRKSRRSVRSADQSGVEFESVEASLDDLSTYSEGIAAGVRSLRNSGMGNAVDAIDSWMVTFSPVSWDAVYTIIDGKRTIIYNGVILKDKVLSTVATLHEVGHGVDEAHAGAGKFSGDKEFKVSRVNGELMAMRPGTTMDELLNHWEDSSETSALGGMLNYPLDMTDPKNRSLSIQELREEVFAQVWAFSNMNGGMDFLRDNLPTTHAFMEKAHEQVKATKYAAAQGAQQGGQSGQVQTGQQDTQPAGAILRASRQRQGLIDRNVAKMPKDLQQPVRNAIGTLTDIAGRGLDYAVFTSDLIGRAEAAGMPAARRFANALAKRNSAANERERRIEKIADMFATIEDRNKGSGAGTVNEFLFESTRTGKWGYDSGSFKADPEMKAMFNALGPKAQAFVKAVFKHGDVMLSEKKKIVMDSATSEYDAMIAAAKVAGDKKAESALLKEKVATLKRFQTLFKIREGLPYAPIKRSGTYAVIGRSDAYNEAVASNNQEQIRKLEQDPKHYQVSFVDSKWEARTLAAEVESSAPGLTVDFVERAEALDDFSGQALLPALTAIRSKVDAQQGTSNTKLLNVISQLYLEALAEDSARKSELRRRGIAGQVDMLSSFTTQGRADANFLASVENNPEVQDALQQMRNQSKTGDRERKSEIFAELSRRYVESLDYKVNPWISKLSGLASKYFLATSPGYYIQNLTQPFMMSVPAMAGKHDYAAAGKALWDAYSELGPIMKSTKLFDQQFDFTQVPEDVKAMVDELVKRGKIDIGLATEINEYKVDADNKLSQFASRLNKGMRLTVQKTEAINRLSTAMAAYRLELKRTGSAEKATEYADRILTETHGDYTAFNAPRIFNSNFGKIALQFRKFQLVQIGFYAKLIRDAFTNPAERAAALRTLGYSLAHTGVFAGALGLPGYAAVAALAGMTFGDDDEPYDLTEEMRKALGPEWANLIMRGAPTLAGVDLSGKVGAGNMLSIAPFMDADLTTQSGVYQAIGTILGGAAGGMTAKMMDGLGLMMGGDFYRGMEQTMPKGIADMLKAGRLTGEGLTRRNGDVLLPEKDVSEVGALFAAIGLPAAQVTSTYQQRQATKKVEDTMQERATQIKNQYAKAYRKQDTASMAEARAAWTKLQEARRRNDMKPQPVSSLLRAPQEQGKREKKIAEQLN